LLFITVAGMIAWADESGELSGIIAGKVEKTAGGFQFVEGPVWHKDGYLLFSNIPARHIVKWTAKDQTSVWRADSGGSNGMTFDREGRLIACEHGNRRVSRTEKDGSIVAVADHYTGKKLNSPNDCIVRSDGMIFFTDPSYGVEKSKKELTFDGVYRVMPGSEPVLLASDFEKPNGIALSPYEKLLYIADTTKNQVRVFQVEKDGSLKEGNVFVSVGNPDGMKIDSRGRLFVTSSEGVAVFDPSGKKLGAIQCPEQPANCAFGGSDNKTLFITARTGLYAVKLQIAGEPVWPVK